MTKADIFDYLYERIGTMTKKEASQYVEVFFDLIKYTLILREEPVKLAGFGTFDLHSKKPRKGRNPQTGEEITISARKLVTFKLSPILKKQLNPHR